MVAGTKQETYALLFHVACKTVKVIIQDTTKAQRQGRGIALPMYNLSARRDGWLVPCTSHFIPRKETLPIVQEAHLVCTHDFFIC